MIIVPPSIYSTTTCNCQRMSLTAYYFSKLLLFEGCFNELRFMNPNISERRIWVTVINALKNSIFLIVLFVGSTLTKWIISHCPDIARLIKSKKMILSCWYCFDGSTFLFLILCKIFNLATSMDLNFSFNNRNTKVIAI